MSKEEFDDMKTITVYNSLYHVPQIGLGHDLYVYVWKNREWTSTTIHDPNYPHNPEPQRFWSYDDPGDFQIIYVQRDGFAYLEINDGERIYHDLTDKNRLKMPGYMRDDLEKSKQRIEWNDDAVNEHKDLASAYNEAMKPRFEHTLMRSALLMPDRDMIDKMSNDGWELVSVIKEDHAVLQYYWKRPV